MVRAGVQVALQGSVMDQAAVVVLDLELAKAQVLVLAPALESNLGLAVALVGELAQGLRLHLDLAAAQGLGSEMVMDLDSAMDQVVAQESDRSRSQNHKRHLVNFCDLSNMIS